MDIRVTNTKNRLVEALLTCLEEKSVYELKVKDIIEVSGVSTRTFYQYYADVNSLVADVNSLVADVENDFIEGYKDSIRRDRESLANIDMTLPTQDQLKAVLSATKNTISYCFDHKREIQLLLSDNGDIRFYNLIFDTSCDEFFERINSMDDSQGIKLTGKERIAMLIDVQVFINSMIDLVRVLLNYSDRLSPYDMRENIMAFLHKTPLDELTSFLKKDKKSSNKNSVD